MKSEDLDPIFYTLIPVSEWRLLKKVNLEFTDFILLKWISFGNKNIFRRYYLKVTYKDQRVKKVALSKANKDELKQKIKSFNQYLKSVV
jgi:hypothetical protein